MGSSLTGRQPSWGKWELRSCPPRSQQQGSLRRRRPGVTLDRGDSFSGSHRAKSEEPCTFFTLSGFKNIFLTEHINSDLVQVDQPGALRHWQGATFLPSQVN